MYTKLCVFLLAVGITQAVAVPHRALQFAYPQTNFIQYLQSRDLTSDPSHKLECLNYYMEQISQVADQFSENYNACVKEAELEKQSIDDKTSEDRTRINQSATDSCELLQSCSTIETSIDFFSCYSEAGSENAKNMYTISANASELQAYVVEQVRLIEVNEYVCTNKSERTYVQDTAAVYEQMNLCFEGGPLPSETTAAPAESTAAPPETTAAPAESTAAPAESTAAPAESTAAPAESTAAPAESTAAPAESTAAPAESTAAPAESTAAPAESTAAPAESTAAPAESTAAPAESTAAPAESTAAPAESTAAPAESTAAPAESTAAPAESTAAPAEPTDAPADKEKAPEEDLSEFSSSQESQNLQNIIQNLQKWLKNRV
ncbi:uncharacterized protein Dana_GF13208 [Drosophila ananassae]|uniref:Protein TsetseEP domain-containing protein n=1 Tax=Drosophila ananassae TaxID=7217 RepID=B3MHV3_DROAN|nr:flocculation protein FLO11 [Drosophila ananassae]EDV36940.1 uncharacterized protein Dana_GF13208 [Drosophila ananassae]